MDARRLAFLSDCRTSAAVTRRAPSEHAAGQHPQALSQVVPLTAVRCLADAEDKVGHEPGADRPAYAAKLTSDQATKHRVACSWCFATTAMTMATLVESLRALREAGR